MVAFDGSTSSPGNKIPNPRRQIRNVKIESFMKSYTFSVLLFLVWGSFSVFRGLTLLERFGFTELLWFVYNVIISLLFLIQMRPAVVSMNPLHWLVAMFTSFSGFIFARQVTDNGSVLSFAAGALILFGLVVGITFAINLGRSYDFLPALRNVKTNYIYAIVRHPCTSRQSQLNWDMF